MPDIAPVLPAAPPRPARRKAEAPATSAVQTSFADLTETLVTETVAKARSRRKPPAEELPVAS
jgi:hypothetical protein